MQPQSLKYLSAQKGATSLHLTKADLSRLSLDVHDDLRKHLSKDKQIELWDGEYKKWWDNGQLEVHCWFKDGYLDGEYKSWYKNGQLESHRWYKDGWHNGEYKSWYKNGQLESHGWYKDGWLDGEFKSWDETGQLESHGWYKDGEHPKKLK